ncbi:Re/Si-specific NAD(P)(+) transhydrogenase subunit beta [Eggerthellaceae bacterium zg-887]|uniref:NAD(P)(+) transhydrogenase (Re/Si-specific) subunit beta n=1 Tax=Xiamenia xianingshaonis TaxID=2682776 RepID=UPI0014093279|nr:NAD(P)(+) transhydrogenase (Re/Si-specific) subunit beta [Xiamenia xianingshaonis]NHM16705.1 Re/Si-specific NAD(P)(+) transhydrogenase subunit beta [Xiamenia xianingshaonis]
MILIEDFVQRAVALATFLYSLQSVAYIAAALLFILALAGLSRQKTAQRGNTMGIIGMAVALLATLIIVSFTAEVGGAIAVLLMLVALAIGAGIGIYKAKHVQMTAMPELVAMLHSFVGAAAVIVGFTSFLTTPGADTPENAFHMGEVGLAVFIGAVTLTGSIVAYLKLAGKMSGKPLTLPGRNAINLGIVIASLLLILWLIFTRGVVAGLFPLVLLTILALLLGAHLVLAIGGGDMPVVVSMLNSLSGWAAAMAGFTLGNDLLIITGALVGSSGAYLSYIMCQGMNRSFASVILGGFGDGATPKSGGGEVKDYGDYTTTSPEEVAEMLEAADSVVIAPGYGMAVAQAQFPVAELARKLIAKGKDVKFGIHPVAGRMPGHMNVLLAEAKVPYDNVFEMDEIDDDFDSVDVVLVIGANDTVNPAALTEPDSPIAGMPVMHVWEAEKVVVSKRSMGAGYAGVQNPLFFNDNTDMLLGDAKESVEAINAALQ